MTPPESEESRKEGRAKAKSTAKPGDWLSMILQHHEQIEAAFAAVKLATTTTRIAAQKKLGIILTGHSNAEEAVIYPALTVANEKRHATMAYTEQAAARTQMALAENLAPMSQDYHDKLEHMRVAVAHHVYEEEGTRFPEIKEKAPAADQSKLTAR